MRIGVMLRAYTEKGGIGVYTRNIIHELLRADERNTYLLYLRDAAAGNDFAAYPHAQVRVLPAASKVLWDQVRVPLAARRDGVDVLFHPKFTAPFLAPCPVVMVVHGADWFMPGQAQYYGRLDVTYIRTLMPLYFRRCARVISVSQLTTDNFRQALNTSPEKIETIYFAPARHFGPVTDPQRLRDVQKRYNLPDRFMLTLTKAGGGDRRKNLAQVFRSYARYHEQVQDPIPLVVGGKDLGHLRRRYAVPDSGYGADILFPGWIEQKDLPAVYSLASLFLYPSNLEAFPIPLTEAMRCGTPIVTSNVNGLQEIAGDAALLVDPTDAEAIAGALARVAADPGLRRELAQRGRARGERFSWDTCVAKTLALLEDVHREAVTVSGNGVSHG